MKASSAIAYKRSIHPLASVERKLASTAAFFAKYGLEGAVKTLFSATSSNDAPQEKVLAVFTSVRDPFWETHISFAAPVLTMPAVLFSESRALELSADYAVPLARAYAELMKCGEETLRRIENFYLSIPKIPPNSLIKEAVSHCFGSGSKAVSSASAQQGAIHIYNTLCRKNSFNCEECEMYSRYSIANPD